MTLCQAKPPKALTDFTPPDPIGDVPVDLPEVGTCALDKGHNGSAHADGNGHIWEG